MMFAILASLLLPAHATSNCAIDLAVERDPDGVYFDRNNMASDVDRGAVLTHLINSVEPGRPILIFDTNPAPALWADANIVTPKHDAKYAAESYDDLTRGERGEIFAEYLARADQTLRETNRPVLVVDHHFASRLLRKTSTTVLLLDFLEWLNVDARGGARDRVRAAFAHGFAIRDHADADIVLANRLTRLAESPAALGRFGRVARAIALYNDHVTLPAGAASRAAAIIGHAMFETLEHHVAPRPGGFRTTLEHAVQILALIDPLAPEHARAEDPIDAFLTDPRAPVDEMGLSEVFTHARAEWTRHRALRAEFATLHASGGLRRVGHALVVEMPVGQRAASGMAILRFVQAAGLATDARALVVVTRETGDARDADEVTHVKIRALGPDVNLDPLMTAIIRRDQGGGGRGGAGGLYGPAGRVVAPEDLANDLSWVIEHI